MIRNALNMNLTDSNSIISAGLSSYPDSETLCRYVNNRYEDLCVRLRVPVWAMN